MKKNDEARKSVIREKEIKTRDILIKQLQFELAKQRNFNNVFEEQLKVQEELKCIESENLIPVIIIPDFTKETILNSNKRFNIRNKIVWIKNFRTSKPSTSIILSLKPKVLIGEIDEETKDRLKGEIITVDTVKPEERKYYAAIEPKKLENEIKKIERKGFLNWLDDYKRRTTEQP
jgi:predicted RNase H-like nuclease (RuvC/YqgF family)